MRTFLASLVLAGTVLSAQAADAPATVQGAWARPIVAGQQSSGAYMTITAREPLTLLGGESPAAGIVEIHQMKMEGDIMKMRAAADLPLAPGKPLQLGPGGYHFMLMDLQAPFKAGTQIPFTLRFRDAKGKVSTLRLSVPVQAAAPRESRQ
ncbi:copper chaperone PCu(A)C [Ramlibacter sp. AN1133]|uniref:copper chaperone PCu(A)C n=1 Tax=Ramlibacter sp. AN1133 TaxID=3133429 RepID=UPI0030C46596